MRILLDVTAQQVQDLNAMAKTRHVARAVLIREAIDKYIQEEKKPLAAYAGLWAGNKKTEDVQGYLDAMRDEWQRAE